MKNVLPFREERLISITCDKCDATYKPTEYSGDSIQAQEFLSFSDTGGYGNTVFGDGTLWSIDLCQHCTKELLGEYIKILK